MRAFVIHDAIANIALMLDNGDNRFLHQLGLNSMHYRVLQLLKQQQGQRLVDLATALLCERSTITRIIDRLEQAGLVQRQADADDRRSQRVILTPEGGALYDRVALLYNESLDRRLHVLNEKEQLQLVELLEKLQNSLRADLSHSNDT